MILKPQSLYHVCFAFNNTAEAQRPEEVTDPRERTIIAACDWLTWAKTKIRYFSKKKSNCRKHFEHFFCSETELQPVRIPESNKQPQWSERPPAKEERDVFWPDREFCLHDSWPTLIACSLTALSGGDERKTNGTEEMSRCASEETRDTSDSKSVDAIITTML